MPPRKPATRGKSKADGFSRLKRAARAFPEAEAGLSYGTPALKVRRKLFARLLEDGQTLVLKADFDSRDAMLKAQPDIFFITDHYRDYPAVLVRLSRVRDARLRGLVEDSWRLAAPKTLISQLR